MDRIGIIEGLEVDKFLDTERVETICFLSVSLDCVATSDSPHCPPPPQILLCSKHTQLFLSLSVHKRSFHVHDQNDHGYELSICHREHSRTKYLNNFVDVYVQKKSR